MENKRLAPAAGNGRRMRTIEFDEADAPLLMAAMRLAAATAMLYGKDQRRAMARLKHYQDLFLQFAPPEARMFDSEAEWCEIAIAMDDAESFEVTWEQGSWPNYAQGRATVTVGRRTWRTGYSKGVTKEQSLDLARAIEEMAPVGCELRSIQPVDDA